MVGAAAHGCHGVKYDEAAMEMRYDEAAIEMKYDEVITIGNVDVMKLLHVDTTGNNVVKTRIEMVKQHMANMKMKYDKAINMRNMDIQQKTRTMLVSYRDIQKSQGLFLEGEGATLIGT